MAYPASMRMPLWLLAAMLWLPANVLGDMTVRTSTGIYVGLQNPEFPHVREFRNVPYAQAPVGKLRWTPPVAVPASKQRRFSYRFPPSCPQYLPSQLSLWNTNISNFMINTYGQSKTSGALAQSTSEDCLSLAIWTPIDVKDDAKLPVAFFMTIGGIDVPYQLPPGWVERSRKHIVVTINYRVNIFGFPGAGGLEQQNLGILDQRMALEWVYANIEAFGGDRDRITMWGHSAGSVAADAHNHAYYDNPLVAGYFFQSGSAMANFKLGDPTHGNFTFVAKSLGCDFPDDAAAELECMRQVPTMQISNFVGQYMDNQTLHQSQPPLQFWPLADEKIVFANYSDRAAKGLIAKVPALISMTSNEQASLIAYPVDNVAAGPNMTTVDRLTVTRIVCQVSNTTSLRARNSLTTYRYLYAGNFSNVTPLSWMGAYHGSDLPMFFGTYDQFGLPTDFQTRVAQTMQDFLFAFIADPQNGLRIMGWLPDDTATSSPGVQYRFGTDGAIAQNTSTYDVDGACIAGKAYNHSP
jgi:carboxylesterase type B